MLIRLLLIIFKVDFESFYTKKVAFIFHFLSTFISLLIYYYTSKAFSSNIGGPLAHYKMDYFSYILYGELSLMTLGGLISFSVQRLKILQIKGVLEQIDFTKTSLLKFICQTSIMSLPRELFIFMTYLIVAIFFFNFQISPISILGILILQLIILPAFLGIIILAIGALIRFGRGTALVGYLVTFSSFFAGAYFPIEVFPNVIQKYSLFLSPFNTLLITIRELVAGQSLSIVFSSNSLVLCLWSIFLFFISVVFLKWSKEEVKKNSIVVFFGR